MFKIFADGERYEVLDVDRVERFCVDFRELRYGEGEKAVLGVFLEGGNSAYFLLDKLEKEAENAFLQCLTHKLNKYDYALEMIDLKYYVSQANELSAGNRLKRSNNV